MRPDQWLHVQPTPSARRDCGPVVWFVGSWVALWLTNVILHGGPIL